MKKPVIFEGIVAILLIILLFAMYVMVTGSVSPTNTGWVVAGNDTISDLYPAPDGTLYAFMGDTGNNISAIAPDGSVKWALDIPSEWRVSNVYWGSVSSDITGQQDDIHPVFTTDNGTLYLYLRENRITNWNYYSSDEVGMTQGSPILNETLAAISPRGNIFWEVALNNNYYNPFSSVSLYATAGRIYAFSDNNVTVFNDSGSVLYRLLNVSDPPAIDENGYIYVSEGNATTLDGELYMAPSGTINAYYPNGSLYWQKTINATIGTEDSSGYGFATIPLYQDNALYVPVNNGVCVLNTGGSLKWNTTINADSAALYHYLPIDSRGNVYFECENTSPLQNYDFMVMATDNGTLVNITGLSHLPLKGDPDNGIVYYLGNMTYSGDPNKLLNLTSLDITAYDLAENKTIWDISLPIGEPTTLIIDAKNASNKSVNPEVFQEAMQDAQNYKNYTPGTAPTNPYLVQSEFDIMVLPGGNITYVGYYTANYEWPLVLGKSRYAYASGIYAINKSGGLVWHKPTDSLVTTMATANNTTFFYGTRNGQVFSGDAGIAGGIAAMAIALLFLRFFLAGTITRARSRIGLNDNRNSALEYIARHPGSTMSEISRGTGMNLGTVRYHLLILGVNHRILGNKPDGKSIRYFTNAGSYSSDEQFLVSLMRRDPMRRVLGLLIVRPGLSNRELSRALDMQESAASRCMRELLDKGVVVRGDSPEGRLSYSVKKEYADLVLKLTNHRTNY
jgi:predicted transcriptional regulator